MPADKRLQALSNATCTFGLSMDSMKDTAI